jgi:hypothetical protein
MLFIHFVIMKFKFWNQLTTHLNLVVKKFTQENYNLDHFPFDHQDRFDNKLRYAMDYYIYMFDE